MDAAAKTVQAPGPVRRAFGLCLIALGTLLTFRVVLVGMWYWSDMHETTHQRFYIAIIVLPALTLWGIWLCFGRRAAVWSTALVLPAAFALGYSMSGPNGAVTSNRFQLKLPPGWSDHSAAGPRAGGAIFMRDRSTSPGALRVSIAEYKGQEPLKFGKDQMAALIQKTADRSGFSDPIHASSGECAFGLWSSAVFHSRQVARAQFWCLTNGRDVIFVSHTCEVEPDPQEVQEAETIVMTLGSQAEGQ